ncbi:hypothetical protein Tco_0646510, partial [Tanacetum coccineum]
MDSHHHRLVPCKTIKMGRDINTIEDAVSTISKSIFEFTTKYGIFQRACSRVASPRIHCGISGGQKSEGALAFGCRCPTSIAWRKRTGLKDTIQLEDVVSTISGEYLLEFTSEYGILEGLHPELPSPEDTTVDFPEGKVGVYTKFFEFANYRIPISQFLFDILGYYQIYLLQLSVIGAAKVSYIEITCCVLNIIPVLSLFRVFYIPSYHSGWMSFSKQPGKNTPQCYTKPLDSLKNWNNRFFWMDEKVFPTVVVWRTGAPKDEMPSVDSYSALDVATLNTRRTPFQKQPELLLCLVGLSRRYFLGDDVYPTFLNDDDREMDLFNLISAPNPAKVKTGTRPRAAHEVPLLTATASRVIEMEDPVATSTSSETPSVMEKSPLDYSSEDLPPIITNKGETEDQAPVVASQEEPPVNKRRRKRDQSAVEGNAPPNVLRKDHAFVHPAQDTRGGEVSSCHRVRSSKIAAVVADPDSENTSFTSMAGSPGSIYQPGWDVTNGCRLDTPGACQDLVDHIALSGYFSEMRHLPNDDFLSQYNINLAQQVAMGSQLRLRFEQEAKLLKKSVAQVAHQDQRIQARENEIKNLEALLEVKADMKKDAEAKNAEIAQVTGEERIKAAFEEFKKYEDDKVEQRCAEMDSRLDKLSVDFDEELYPHMLTAIAGRRWVIGHGLRLAVMKCVESLEIRRKFDDVVSAGLAKGMSEGLRYGIEYGKAGRDLVDVKAYDPEANSKLVKALQDLKDLKYPMVDELERLKDAPVELIMASLHLESDTGEDAPQWIHDLRPSSLQLKIPIYPEKCRVVCHTHGIGFAHHPRSDGNPVSAPTVVPQGLAILVADATTQT